MDSIEEKPLLTLLLDEQEKYLALILNILKDEELLFPFNDNHLVEFYTDEAKEYIPLFTDRNRVKKS